VTARKVRTAWLPAWRVHDGDRTPAGVAVVCVLRNLATGHVRTGHANGSSMTLAGDRPAAVAPGPR